MNFWRGEIYPSSLGKEKAKSAPGKGNTCAKKKKKCQEAVMCACKALKEGQCDRRAKSSGEEGRRLETSQVLWTP
jgi:hypothetical protein